MRRDRPRTNLWMLERMAVSEKTKPERSACQSRGCRWLWISAITGIALILVDVVGPALMLMMGAGADPMFGLRVLYWWFATGIPLAALSWVAFVIYLVRNHPR